ncbi:hypothetical protein OHA77_36045 [Streptosporangium sp. NBC_01639]|uniref:WD40 repeat domain-containing protein n=1 Tax=Streptosporangium sp. NBC_01639 TaxID=2975948 RepID=UPI003864D81D|nr:hypothetical protein OHA77_36045 [Streptosporangium sp. NBC_01639]
MSSLDGLLNARPTKEVWQEVCLRLAELDEEELAAVAPRVLSWPAQQRPMPDDWWAQWTAGDVRPYHSLAGIRHLGTLDHVEAGRAASGFEASNEDEDTDRAYFYHGASAVAAPSDLTWIALGAAAEWHHNGGDIVGWNTLEDDRLTWFLAGADYHDEPYDMQISPDGRTVVTSVEGRWHAWSAETGDELWVLPEGSRLDDEEEDDDNDEDDEDDEDDGSLGMDDLVRIGFSGDSRRVAAGTCESGTVAVVETETGRVVLNVPAEQNAFGPVALDARGRLLAHTAPEGRVVIREADGGTVLATAQTGLTDVSALAFAPDGAALFAVGGAVEGGAVRGAQAGPAARILNLDPAPDHPSLTVGALVRPTELPGELDTASPFTAASTRAASTRAAWTDRGPFAFVTADRGSVLFDSAGRTLWAHPGGQKVSFTPDGQAMVTVGESIDAWFLAGLAVPERTEPGAADRTSGSPPTPGAAHAP